MRCDAAAKVRHGRRRRLSAGGRPPLVQKSNEWEIYHRRSAFCQAESAKRDLDSLIDLPDVLSDIDAMRLAIEHDGAHLNDLQTEIELADLEGLGAIADYSKLVVFMQRCDGGECLGDALNSTEAQLTALLAATATDHASPGGACRYARRRGRAATSSAVSAEAGTQRARGTLRR